MRAALDKLALYGTLPPRLALGVIFLAHGSQKLFGAFDGPGLQGVAGFMGPMGFTPPMFWAVLLSGTEFFGGLGVLVGLLTRLSALGLAVAMIVAIGAVHIQHGLFAQNHGMEYPLALLGMSLGLLLTGAGRISLDYACCGKKRQAPATS